MRRRSCAPSTQRGGYSQGSSRASSRRSWRTSRRKSGIATSRPQSTTRRSATRPRSIGLDPYRYYWVGWYHINHHHVMYAGLRVPQELSKGTQVHGILSLLPGLFRARRGEGGKRERLLLSLPQRLPLGVSLRVSLRLLRVPLRMPLRLRLRGEHTERRGARLDRRLLQRGEEPPFPPGERRRAHPREPSLQAQRRRKRCLRHLYSRKRIRSLRVCGTGARLPGPRVLRRPQGAVPGMKHLRTASRLSVAYDFPLHPPARPGRDRPHLPVQPRLRASATPAAAARTAGAGRRALP